MLACPYCKSPFDPKQTTKRSGPLFCVPCGKKVGELRFGKADFIRSTDSNIPTESASCNVPYSYKRVPWNSRGVIPRGLTEKHLGWTPEGYGGSLYSEGTSEWELCIETTAVDVDLRIESGPENGIVEIFLDGMFLTKLFPQRAGQAEIVAYPIYRNRPAGKVSRIMVRPAPFGNLNGRKSHFCFSGYDAAFGQTAWPASVPLNRGNRYPDTYTWAVNLLPSDGLALDCGSGDRTFGDPRVIGFEYLPFELPDVFGDGHALPFCDNSFDIVFSQAVMEHMSDPFLAAREIARVLKPGGMLYVESAFMQPLHAVPYHFFNTTPWGIKELFTRAGLDSVALEWFGHLSGSVKWYLDVCGASGRLAPEELNTILAILGKADAGLSYNDLQPVASAVAMWAVKPGPGCWLGALTHPSRPTYTY